MINPHHLIRKRVPKGGSEERLWHYAADNGRLFEVRQFGRAKFLLGEFRPNGRIAIESNSDFAYESSPVVSECLETTKPNQLNAVLSERGIDVDTVVRQSPGIAINSFYHGSLEEVCSAIEECLRANEWYYKKATPSDDEVQAQKARALVDRVAFWTGCREALNAAMTLPGFFKGCHSKLGPLGNDAQKLILSFVNNPNQEGWLEIRNMLITVNTTLWAAWCRIDPNAPRAGSVGFPGASTLRKAIVRAISEWEVEVTDRLQSAISETSKPPTSARLEVVRAMR